MMRLFSKSVLVVLLASTSYQTLAEDILTTLSNAGVEIRKTFNGTAVDTASPASFIVAGGSGRDTYQNIDLAVKVSDYEFDFDRQGRWHGRVYPSFEVHKNSDVKNEAKNAQAALSFEFEQGLGACAVNSSPFCTSLFWDAAFKVKRDSHNDKTTKSASLFMTYSEAGNEGSIGPNSVVILGDAFIKLIYLPLLGVEYHRNLPIEEKVDGETVEIAGAVDESFAVARLNVNVIPFATALDEKLKLVLDYSFRSRLGDSELVDKSNGYLDLSLDFYLDEKDRVAIGFGYSKGKSPTRNFLDEEKWGFGFKFKL